MYIIQTRQKPDCRGWWCNGTIEGYDHSFEAKEMKDAQHEMIEFLKKRNLLDSVRWEYPKYYSKNGCMSKACLIAQTTRLTHD